MATTPTKLSDLINPEVLSAFLETKLVDSIKLSPLAVVGTDLQGKPGDTLTIPVWQYIGDANDLGEGESDTPVKLTATSTQITVKKAAKAVELSDEALLSGYGDPAAEVASQLLTAISSKVEKDCYAALATATLSTTGPINGDTVADALIHFGEDLEEEMFLFINPTDYAAIRKNPSFQSVDGRTLVIGGTVGFIHNCAVVLANRVAKNSAYIIKRGALGIEIKRGVNVESDRDILAKTNVYAADEHYIAYLRDNSKVIKIQTA